MQTVWVFPAKPGDGAEFLSWNQGDPNFDPKVAAYPNSFTLKAFDGSRTIMYMPVQQPFFMDSLATNPEATPVQITNAMKEVVQETVSQAAIKNVNEIYFLGTNDQTSEIAKNHGFTELPYKIFRLRLDELENKCSSPQK